MNDCAKNRRQGEQTEKTHPETDFPGIFFENLSRYITDTNAIVAKTASVTAVVCSVGISINFILLISTQD